MNSKIQMVSNKMVRRHLLLAFVGFGWPRHTQACELEGAFHWSGFLIHWLLLLPIFPLGLHQTESLCYAVGNNVRTGR